MARTKARWHGRILRNMFRDGGSVVLLGRMEHDPDRITEFRVNRSNVVPFTLSVLKEAELTTEEVKGLIEALTKMIEPRSGEQAGKGLAEEF